MQGELELLQDGAALYLYFHAGVAFTSTLEVDISQGFLKLYG